MLTDSKVYFAFTPSDGNTGKFSSFLFGVPHPFPLLFSSLLSLSSPLLSNLYSQALLWNDGLF